MPAPKKVHTALLVKGDTVEHVVSSDKKPVLNKFIREYVKQNPEVTKEQFEIVSTKLIES